MNWQRVFGWWFAAAGLVTLPVPVHAMHISEGILPLYHALFWTVVGGGFVYMGIRKLVRISSNEPMLKPFISMVGAAVFLISAMPIPVPFAGTVSHPAGTGIAAILIGPLPTVVVTSITLLLHALFLAHGGLSTLGADVFAMGVLGGFGGYGAYWLSNKLGFGTGVSAFAAGLAGDWCTYLGTSGILAWALHDPQHGVLGLFLTVVVAFMPTQIPLGILEGVVAMSVFHFLHQRRPEFLKRMRSAATITMVFLVLMAGVGTASTARGADTEAWPGVDVAVVEKKAEEHGRPARGPLIPLEGDLLLFAFLVAGGVGGFALGYYYRAFFVEPSRVKRDSNGVD